MGLDSRGGTSQRRRAITTLREERAGLVQQMREMSDAAEAARRDFTTDEERTYDGLEARAVRLAADIAQIEADLLEEGPVGTPSGIRGLVAPEQEPRGIADGGATFSRQRKPEGVRLFEPQERLADTGQRNTDKLDLGYLIACVVEPTMRNQRPAEARALAEGAEISGGIIVPTLLGREVVDLARNQTRTIQAGARTVEMDSKTLTVPRIAGGVAATWRGEGEEITEDDITFDSVELTAHSLSVLVRGSREVFSDMTPTGAASITHDITSAIALAWDKAALRGSGSGDEPEGLRFNTSVPKTAAFGVDGGVPSSYAELVQSVGRVKGANFSPGAFIMSARTEATYGGLTSSADDQPLHRPDYLNGIAWLPTQQVPNNLVEGSSSTVCSEIYVGQFDQLVIGVREGLNIQILHELYAETGEIGLVVHWRGDVAVLREAAFEVLTGVKAG